MKKKELKEIIARKDLMISDIKQTAINYKLKKALELLKEVGELEVELTYCSNGCLPDFLYSEIYNIKLKIN